MENLEIWLYQPLLMADRFNEGETTISNLELSKGINK
jgi:hypothetical protein